MPTDYATLKADPIRWVAHLERTRRWNKRNREYKAQHQRDYNAGLITRYVYRSIGKDGRERDFTGPFKLRALAIEWGNGKYGLEYWRKRGVTLKLCKVEYGEKK